MDDTRQHVANRCLPLLIANQSGWWILNDQPIRATWTGGWDPTCVRIERLDHAEKCAAVGHFGEGVLTFILPFLFRTSPGFNLHVRGPANLQKDGIAPLEGIVETDWTVATFTMNWRFTRPHAPVVFEKDEPICMVTPQPRALLESFVPEIRDVRRHPEVFSAYMNWSNSRSKFLHNLKTTGPKTSNNGWQKHYFRGVELGGADAPQHQVKLELREFTEEKPSSPAPIPQSPRRSSPPPANQDPAPFALSPLPQLSLSATKTLAKNRRPKNPAADSKTGRNDPCPCGSGKKYKKCCMDKA